jgi:hypothetical protein
MNSILQPKTILFDSNGGSYVPPQTLIKNEKISEPRTPVKEGYYFTGWFSYFDDYYINNDYMDDDYYNNYRWDFDVIPNGDMTLYAMWDEKPAPTERDFIIENLKQFIPNPSYSTITAVAVTLKDGKTLENVTVYYEGTNGTIYDKSTTKPSNIGSYKVTFDIVADTKNNWNAANGLYAGTLEINVFKSITDLGEWLYSLGYNDPDTAYPVALNVDNLGVSTRPEETGSAAGSILKDNETKFVSLDLSGSSFINISESAFRSCNSLIGVTIGKDVTGIGKETFLGCTALTNITIPDKVNSIGDSAFQECHDLTRVTFEGTIERNNSSTTEGLNPSAFEGNLYSVIFPSNNVSNGTGTYTRARDGETWTRIQ